MTDNELMEKAKAELIHPTSFEKYDIDVHIGEVEDNGPCRGVFMAFTREIVGEKIAKGICISEVALGMAQYNNKSYFATLEIERTFDKYLINRIKTLEAKLETNSVLNKG